MANFRVCPISYGYHALNEINTSGIAFRIESLCKNLQFEEHDNKLQLTKKRLKLI